MRQILKHTWSFVLMVSCISAVRAQVPDVNKEEINEFISEFKAAVLAQDQRAIMDLMDPAYKMEQHDKFHEGNTKRFLDELFCGNVPHSDVFRCMKLKKVRSIELAGLGEGNKNISAVFRVSDKKGAVDVMLTIVVRTEGGKKKYGIVGAVG